MSFGDDNIGSGDIGSYWINKGIKLDSIVVCAFKTLMISCKSNIFCCLRFYGSFGVIRIESA